MNCLFLICILSLLLLVDCDEEFSDKTIILEHAFEDQIFHNRSVFTFQAQNSKFIPVDNENNGINEIHIESFKSLLKSNDFYRIRVNSQIGNSSSPYIFASLPAVSLILNFLKQTNAFCACVFTV